MFSKYFNFFFIVKNILELIYISINLNYKYTFIFVKKTFGDSKPNLKTVLV